MGATCLRHGTKAGQAIRNIAFARGPALRPKPTRRANMRNSPHHFAPVTHNKSAVMKLDMDDFSSLVWKVFYLVGLDAFD
jgi:hypothetical protein